MYQVALQLTGLDIESSETIARIEEARLTDLEWVQTDGRMLVMLQLDTNDPVSDICDVVRRIEHGIPGVTFFGIDLDLVGVSDIALRIGVHRETVRLWSVGARGPGDFPPPIGTVSGALREGGRRTGRGNMRIWDWGSVNEWLRQTYSLGDGYQHLTASQIAELDASLRRVKSKFDDEWEGWRKHEPKALDLQVREEQRYIIDMYRDLAVRMYEDSVERSSAAESSPTESVLPIRRASLGQS